MLVEGPLFQAGLVSNFHLDLHHKVAKVRLPYIVFNCRCFGNNLSFFHFFDSILVAFERVQVDYKKLEEDLHVQIILDYNIQIA